jgi:nucleoid-associated protein YgaU
MGIFDKLMGKKDKPKADFSNVRSGGSSTAPAPASPSASRPAATKRTYTVVSGDSLSKIAQREYGDAQQWRKIYDANRDQIANPDLIHPGQVLNIPS